MNKRIKISIVTLEIKNLDDVGCITNTHQCGPCCFNTVCSSSTKSLFGEPSPSNFSELQPGDFRELDFN